MTDVSNFGSNLGSLGSGDAGLPPGSTPDAQPMPQPTPAAPQQQQQSLGSMLGSILPGPNYRAPDPNATPLDQTADTLQQRIQRANSIASNPVLQFFNPEGVQAARNFVPAATEQLQKIRQQKADMQANAVQAQTLGLSPGEVPDEATQADRVAVAQNKALQGNLQVFKGLQAVDPKAAEAIQDKVHEAVAGHLSNAQLAFDSLAAMQNEGQYQAKLNQLRQDGTISDLESLGLKIPKDFNGFNATKAQEGRALREAKIGVDTIRQKLEDRNTYQPMEEKEAKTYNGRLTTAYGDQITNGTWARNGASNARGLIVNGAADPRDLGKTFTFATPEQRTAIKDEFSAAVPKEGLEKYRAFNRTYTMATTDAKGSALPQDKINTNPNVQQGIAEGLASMLRGGTGGANVGLLKIELAKRGWAQGSIDNLVSNYAGALNTLFTNADKPYLSPGTQKQIRDVMDVLKTYNNGNITDRVSQIAQRAGALGLDSNALGFGKDESKGVIGDAIEQGRQAQIARMMPYHQAIGGGDGVFQIGAQRPGADATGLPPGTAPTTQLPGAAPLQTPVQQATNSPALFPASAPPAAPNPGTSPPNGSGPAGGSPAQMVPTTVAGQSVNVPPSPPGASPDYLSKVQQVESGNSKNPWTTGTPRSSASGAFQFISSTWADDKPPGAPARAGDATPQQQAEAAATRTAKNGQTLASAGLPVSDTNLYVLHNLGEGAGPALLKADPNADARSIVGETAARNNPKFFRGKPTVAVALARYDAAMNPEAGSITIRPEGAAPFTPNPADVQNALGGSAAGRSVAGALVNNAPAIGSTAGAVGGGILGGPLGAIGGGAAGGGAGQVFKDWAQGNAQSPAAIAKQTALGGVLGIVPEGRPLVGAALRVGGVAGTEAAAEAGAGGSGADITDAAVKGGAYALGGEALGRFVSSAGAAAYKVLSRYTTSAQQELSAAAGKLAEARGVLASEPPKIPGVAGAADSVNPKYQAAQDTAKEMEETIKEHGQVPDDMVHAYEQAKAGVSAGEALTMRKANAEKRAVGQGYNDLRQSVTDTGVGAVKPGGKLADGPVSMLRTADNPTGKVPAQFQPEAEHAEMLATAPAKNWGEKWQQLQNAGSELIQKRMAFLQAGDKPSADAMDSLFDGVRNQQKAAANYVFGPKVGPQKIAELENLDQRYAKIMSATQGMSYTKMQSVLAQGNTPAARQLEANFKAFAKDDPGALRAFNAMKAGARGDWKSEASLMAPVIAGEVAANMHGVPTVGAISALVGGQRLYRLVQGYMNARVLGTPVQFKDFLAQEAKSGRLGDIARRGLVMGQTG